MEKGEGKGRVMEKKESKYVRKNGRRDRIDEKTKENY